MLATGVEARTLGVPGEERLNGASVYYGAAASEAVSYSGCHVVVVGGANSAGQGAMFLSRYAEQVTIIVRADSLAKSMSQYLIDQIELAPNITVVPHSEISSLTGEQRLESVQLRDRTTGEESTMPADAMFVFIGAVPGSDLVRELVETDDHGFVLTGLDLVRDGKRPSGWKLKRDPLPQETSVPGIFAAGDVRHDVIRRVASAVGQGSVAVSLVHQYLETV